VPSPEAPAQPAIVVTLWDFLPSVYSQQFLQNSRAKGWGVGESCVLDNLQRSVECGYIAARILTELIRTAMVPTQVRATELALDAMAMIEQSNAVIALNDENSNIALNANAQWLEVDHVLRLVANAVGCTYGELIDRSDVLAGPIETVLNDFWELRGRGEVHGSVFALLLTSSAHAGRFEQDRHFVAAHFAIP